MTSKHYKGLLVISCYKVIVRRSVETPKFSFILKYTTIQNVSVITYAPKGGGGRGECP